MSDFVLQPNATRELVKKRVHVFIDALSDSHAWQITIKQWKKARTLKQNAALWSLVYPTILREGGEAMRGWEAADLHEYFLGECWGWEVAELLGKKRQRPLRRSSKLDRADFAFFFDFIQRKAAEFGVYVADPNPDWKHD